MEALNESVCHKIPTYLTGSSWAGQLSIKPVPTHSYKLSRGVPIGVRKAWNQPNHGISSLEVVAMF